AVRTARHRRARRCCGRAAGAGLFAHLCTGLHPPRHGRVSMSERQPEMHERRILGTELLWAFGVGVLIAATLSVIVFTALTMGINPPSNVERVDPKALHLSGEFANLGTSVAADGSVTARVIATQFMFVPRCIAVPQGRPVTL